MAHVSSDEFEALWQSCEKQPAVLQAESQIRLDLSLSQMLDQYLVMADRFLAQGKIKKSDHEALSAAIGDLKPILDRIGEKELIAQEIGNRARVRGQQLQDEVAKLSQVRR